MITTGPASVGPSAKGKEMTMINRRNYDPVERWYKLGDVVAWYDRRARVWTSYVINEAGHQISDTVHTCQKETLTGDRDDYEIEG